MCTLYDKSDKIIFEKFSSFDSFLFYNCNIHQPEPIHQGWYLAMSLKRRSSFDEDNDQEPESTKLIKKQKLVADSNDSSGSDKPEDKNDNESTSNAEKDENKEEKIELLSKSVRTGKNKTTIYKYIDTKEKLQIAIADIRKITENETVAVDCEGRELSRFGSLTLLNIGTREVIYLIDVLKIGELVFKDGLREILEDSAVKKFMFDCREDSDALFHNYGVKLDGVLDIQLLDVYPRRNSYPGGFVKIKGLKECLEIYTMSDSTMYDIKVNGRDVMDSAGRAWEKRPLNDILLEYAVVDIVSLFTLYDKLSSRMTRSTWIEASKRYCNSKRSRHRTYRDGSNRLPSGTF